MLHPLGRRVSAGAEELEIELKRDGRSAPLAADLRRGYVVRKRRDRWHQAWPETKIGRLERADLHRELRGFALHLQTSFPMGMLTHWSLLSLRPEAAPALAPAAVRSQEQRAAVACRRYGFVCAGQRLRRRLRRLARPCRLRGWCREDPLLDLDRIWPLTMIPSG